MYLLAKKINNDEKEELEELTNIDDEEGELERELSVVDDKEELVSVNNERKLVLMIKKTWQVLIMKEEN